MTAAATPLTELTVPAPLGPPPSHPYEAATVWSLLTLGGSIIAAGLSTMLRTMPDSGRIVWGRSLGALVAGILGSRLAAALYPQIWNWCTDPLLLVALSVGLGLVGYAASYPLVNTIDKISPRLVKSWLRSLLMRYLVEGRRKEGDDDPPEPSPPPPAAGTGTGTTPLP